MGNATSWITQTFCPEEQVVWAASKIGDLATLQTALSRLTPQNRVYLEWKDPVYAYTPLATASVEGHVQCVIALLAVGVDVNARDNKGYTPLHLATLNGKSEVVRVLLDHPAIDVHARTTTKRHTPLDLARYEYNNAYDGKHRLVQCIELIEKKMCVYSGWLHQRVDNLLSMASGLSSLNSWKRRYCMVLRTADPDVVEIDLFSMKPGEKRPPCPDMEIVYKLSSGFDQHSDSTWFNRKEHRFSINAYTRSGISRVSAPQTFDFAATSQADLVAWKTFFSQLRMGVPPVSASEATAASAAPAAVRANSSSSMLEEQRNLERALQLSLDDARRSSAVALAAASVQPPPASRFASAPSWSEAMPDSPQAMIAPDGVEIVQPISVGFSFGSQSPPAAAPSEPDAGSGHSECVICFDGPQSAVCVPCGHNAICMNCAGELLQSTRQCPVCRGVVREVVKLYRV